MKAKLLIVFSAVLFSSFGNWGIAVDYMADIDRPAEARTVTFIYQFRINNIPPGSRSVSVWVPVPVTNSHQIVHEVKIEDNLNYAFLPEPKYGNLFAVIDLTDKVADGLKDIPVRLTFRVTRWAYRALGEPKDAEHNYDLGQLRQFLLPNQLVPIGGRIAREARSVTQNLSSPLDKGHRLYEHIVNSVRYDKSVAGYGRGDALFACDNRAGNCTDFHSLFIGEARALGIPARFVIGFPLPEDRTEGKIAGYHCWAEFYVENKGWIPLDASEASKNPEKIESFFGELDANRIQFTVGRDIQIPRTASGPTNYSIYPHIEVDGVVHTDMEASFYFRE